MRTWWTATAAVVGLCVVPALTEARDRDHAERRHPSPSRHEDRGARGDEGRRQRSEARSEDRGRRDDRPASGWSRPESRRSDERSSGWNRGNGRGRQDDRRSQSWGRSDDRGRRDERSSGWGRRDDRRYDSRDRRYESRDRRPEVRWRSPYRETFRYRPYVRVRPLRYPSSYRYGYYHRRGWYYPRYYFDYGVYSDHASLRILAEPVETEVYVDGYYAGVVDEFDGIFQRLHVAPGPHEITLRLDGFETWSGEIFAAPGSTVNLRHYMRPGPSGDDEAPYDEAPPYGYDDPRQ
ncbi:MAG: PEGA domain-containing protein [Vicinamibacteria bacterium]